MPFAGHGQVSAVAGFAHSDEMTVLIAPGSVVVVRDDNGEQQQQQQQRVGNIYIENDQTALSDIDVGRIETTISKIRKAIGYDDYGVSLLLVDDEEMTLTNFETRNVDSPTDILSFPMHDSIKPGMLIPIEPHFQHIPDYCNLGDMMIDVPYVVRRCREDMDDGENNTDDSDDVERGVSGAMSKSDNVQDRINMLLVHGMLHLVGYDHENDNDYEQMVTEEERILKELGFFGQE